MRASILGIRFLCELALLTGLAYAYAYAKLGEGAATWVFAIGAPAIAAVIWATFISPKARIRPPLAVRVSIEIDLFTIAAVGLWFADAPVAAVALAVLGIATSVLNAMMERAGATITRADRNPRGRTPVGRGRGPRARPGHASHDEIGPHPISASGSS